MKIISCDPGLHGAICVKSDTEIFVYDIPLVEKNDKKVFDIPEIVKIFDLHKDASAFLIEDVHVLFGNGAVSMFNFGRGKGILEGIAFAKKIQVLYVSPQTWKKKWPELIAPKMDKEEKTKYTAKELQKIKTQKKAKAKVAARELAGKLEPTLKDLFKKVNSDGRAEAVLLNYYATDMIKEQYLKGNITI